MDNPLKIFILYARFGDGHWQAASALRQSFAKLGRVEVKLVDLLGESHPLLNEVSRFVYRKSYTVLPQAYGWVYQRTRTMKPDSLLASWLHSFGVPALQKMVEDERPDAIVHTFPTLACSQVMHKLRRKIPMFNVITDFDLHLRWVHPDTDKYYVATDDMLRQLCELGVDPRRVAATGIPIRPEFQTSAAAGTGALAGKPTVLVMAGAGMAPARAAGLCRSLARRCDARVVVVCGRNRALRQALEEQLGDDPRMTILGYVERIQEWMAVSSCIVTKPGGLTLSEAIASGLPIFLYRPVPGQEYNNARYLENKGAAVICGSIGQLTNAIAERLEKPRLREQMLQVIYSLRKPDAADTVALDIARQLNIMEVVPDIDNGKFRHRDDSSRVPAGPEMQRRAICEQVIP